MFHLTAVGYEAAGCAAVAGLGVKWAKIGDCAGAGRHVLSRIERCIRSGGL